MEFTQPGSALFVSFFVLIFAFLFYGYAFKRIPIHSLSLKSYLVLSALLCGVYLVLGFTFSEAAPTALVVAGGCELGEALALRVRKRREAKQAAKDLAQDSTKE